MPATYAYKVRDRAGKVVEGELEADNQQLVIAKLRERGLTPISIQEQASSNLQREIKIPGLSDRVKLKELAVFARQFSTMINAGLTMLRALAVLGDQTESKALAKVIQEVRLDVERGASLSQALSRHPKVFNRLFVSMVKAGEAGGTLDQVLVRLATTIERQVELRRKIISAMAYPIVVAVLVFFITLGMLLFVVPTFEGLYAELGGTLPLPTRVLIGISGFMRKFWWILGGLAGAGIYGFRRWKKSDTGRVSWDRIRLRMPIFGGLVRKTALARFGRTLAALTRSGVPILESLEIVADTSGNEVVAIAVHDAQRGVKQGEPIAQPLATHEVFPPMVIQMMTVGEETGALDEMLDKIAEFYEQEVQATIDALTSLIEPLLIVVMGIVVGGMIISLYLPMFRIINLVQ